MQNKDLIILIIVGLIFSIALQSIAFTSKYIVNDDVRTALFPISKLNDHELFPDDLLEKYITEKGSTKPLILFYALIDKFTDYILITKILPIILFILSLILFYLTAKQFLNNTASFISTVIYLYFAWTLQLFSGGTSRAFAMPLIAIFLYFFMKDKTLPALITIIISSLFYPPITLILSLTYALTFLNNSLSEIKSKRFLLFLISIIIVFLLIFQSKLSETKEIGSMFSISEFYNMQEVHLNGKIPALNGILSVINPYNAGIKFSLTKNPIALLIIAAIILAFTKTKTNLPKKIKLFAVSGLILYFIALIIPFKIYIPIRYLLPVYLFLIFFISSKLQNINLNLTKKIILIILLFIIFLPHLRRDLTICKNPEIYNFINTLPKDSLIAGYPKDLDCIPLYSERSVLINDEMNIPFYKTYYLKIKERLTDLFKAYYSDNELEIKEFCNKYKVTHLLINKDRFSNEFLNKEVIYPNPFNTLIKENKNNNFILPKLINKSIFSSDNQFIISC